MGKQQSGGAGSGGGGQAQSNNCASFIAGIIEGLLCSAKMQCKVTAHLYGSEETTQNTGEEPAKEEQTGQTTIYVIKFTKEVTAREK